MDRALLASLVLLNAGTALVACSGVSVTAEGAAGSHAGGGASGAVSPPGGGSAGAGGAPVLRPAQANLALSLQPTTGAVNCPVPGMTYVVGNPDGPTDVTPGDRLIDGEHGASIMCSVRGSGPYTFSGTIHAASSQNDPVTVTITNGVINADKRTGSATVSVITPQLAGAYGSAAGGCLVTVVGQNVKPGSLWAMLSCPSISSLPSGLCAIGPISAFVLENCDGS